MVKILVAPDSFKGSLSAEEFCAIATRELLQLDAGIEVDSVPMADGGEGTARALVRSWGAQLQAHMVADPLHRKCRGFFGISTDGQRGAMDLASASGLAWLTAAELDPMRACTLGSGQLLAELWRRQVPNLVIGLGGSATVDGGAGLLTGLGYRLLDAAGEPIPAGATGLLRLATIADEAALPRLAPRNIIVAHDVTAPLLGPHGASAQFGPQKGATPADIPVLEQALSRLAVVVGEYCHARGHALRLAPTDAGAGAAGGCAFTLANVLGASLRPGFDLVAAETGFEAKLKSNVYDWLLTGEGRIDAQSRHGKVLSGIGRLAAPTPTRTVAFTGCLDGDERRLDLLGIDHLFSIIPGPCSLETALANAEAYLASAIRRVMSLALSRTK